MTDKNKKPDLNKITAADLASDERLRSLYMQACRAGFWTSRDASSVLTFWSIAEKALQEDKHGTPGALFYQLIKKKDWSKVTNAQEDRATARVNSAVRNDIHYDAERIKPVQRRLALSDPEEVSSQLFGRNIGYHHGIMVQCFMPQERQTETIWQSSHGKARMAIQAGLITDPSSGELVQSPLPYGSKARLIIPYINAYAIQHKTSTINLGKTLRKFFENLGLEYGGSTGRIIVEQINAVAAAQFTLGFVDGEGTQGQTDWARVAKSMSFWIERDPEQGLFWEQEMLLSNDYIEAIEEHRVPLDMDHMVKLGKARRQDMYAWFSYRLPKLRGPLNIPYATLHSVFGQGIADPYKFRQQFREDLRAISKVYDGFNIETPSRKDYVKLAPSKSPVPSRITRLIPKN